MQSHALSFFAIQHEFQPVHPPSGYHQYPHRKRRRLNSGGTIPFPTIDLYTCLLLEKGRRIYLEEEDEWNVITPLWVEWNPAIRRCLGRMPRLLSRRLLYLSRFHGETTIYHPCEDIVLVEHLQDQMYAAYYRECRLKQVMRNVWGRWKCFQMDRRSKGAAVDPVTLSEPEKPVVVYSWTHGRRYTFEAKSLSLHVEAQLCHHSGGFPVPQRPRNPWNNVHFTPREMITIYLQLKQYGELRWALQTFHGAQYDIDKWGREQYALLLRTCLQDAIRNLDHLPILRQSMLQFIMDVLEDGNCHQLDDWKIIYEYSLEYLWDHPVIQQWGQWYIQSHVPHSGIVNIELPRIWKRQHLLARAILIRERPHHEAAVAAADI